MKIGCKVKVLANGMMGKIAQIGAKGLILVNFKELESAFQRTVYYPSELEIVEE